MKKNRFIFVIPVIALLLSGCGSSEMTADVDALADDVMKNVTFRDELTRVDGAMAEKLYDMDGVSRSCVMVGSGATAEELAVFEFVDEDSARAAVAVAEARIASQRASFADYMPEEALRLDSAVIKQSGRCLIVCVSDGGDAAGVIDKYMR